MEQALHRDHTRPSGGRCHDQDYDENDIKLNSDGFVRWSRYVQRQLWWINVWLILGVAEMSMFLADPRCLSCLAQIGTGSIRRFMESTNRSDIWRYCAMLIIANGVDRRHIQQKRVKIENG